MISRALHVGRRFIAPIGYRRVDGALKPRPTAAPYSRAHRHRVGRRFIAPNSRRRIDGVVDAIGMIGALKPRPTGGWMERSAIHRSD